MGNVTIKDALRKSMQATKAYIDNKTLCLEDIDYDSMLAFDTNEIVFETSETATSAVLGKGILNRLILDNDSSNTQ